MLSEDWVHANRIMDALDRCSKQLERPLGEESRRRLYAACTSDNYNAWDKAKVVIVISKGHISLEMLVRHNVPGIYDRPRPSQVIEILETIPSDTSVA